MWPKKPQQNKTKKEEPIDETFNFLESSQKIKILTYEFYSFPENIWMTSLSLTHSSVLLSEKQTWKGISGNHVFLCKYISLLWSSVITAIDRALNIENRNYNGYPLLQITNYDNCCCC